MTVLKCQSVRESLLAHLASATAVAQIGDSCVATLPIPTLDGRLTDVFIEATVSDYCVVHDGGKAVNELILQGLNITDSITEYFDAIAKRFKVSYAEEMFRATVKSNDVQSTMLAVGMCSSLAIGQLVGHVTSLPDEPVREQFGHALKSWAKRSLKVSRDVPVKGRRSRHRFDFVASPKTGHRKPIAMSVLSPGNHPLRAAQSFGFIAADLDTTPFEKWPRVAIQGRAELWSPEAKNILRNCANVVIEIPTDSKIDARLIEEHLQGLVAA